MVLQLRGCVSGANSTSLSKKIVLQTVIHGFEKGPILFRFGLGNVAASPWTVRSLKTGPKRR